ncbi:L10-interacting MYB domain-containing protein-like [Pyrus communis]|uniref:L10-interacting MYB domain-containing protein-like n=1 Tax=Pyrus communis TaxID=23211 RepID=UPI0035BFACE4
MGRSSAVLACGFWAQECGAQPQKGLAACMRPQGLSPVLWAGVEDTAVTRAKAANRLGASGPVEVKSRPRPGFCVHNNDMSKNIVRDVQDAHGEGGHLNRIGWKSVIKKFNDLTQRSHVHKQLKNKWTTLEKEWQLWTSLVGKETGLGWDPVKQTIIANDEWWQKKMKENIEVAKYRNNGLKNVDQLDILFKEGAVTGVGAWAPSQGLMSNNVQKAPIGEQNDGQDDLENDIDNNDGLDDVADA